MLLHLRQLALNVLVRCRGICTWSREHGPESGRDPFDFGERDPDSEGQVRPLAFRHLDRTLDGLERSDSDGRSLPILYVRVVSRRRGLTYT